MASLKQARYIRKQIPEAEIYIFYIDIRSPGRLEDFYQASQEDERLHLIKGKVAKVTRNGSDNSLEVFAEDALSGRKLRQTTDLVVLATGMVANLPDLGGSLMGDEHGFLISTDQDSGILPSGSVRRPIEVAESVRDATRAALKAIQSARS
jgi:quinone-modifying oxidoreductase subunit QmoA